MLVNKLCLWLASTAGALALHGRASDPTAGVKSLVQRRLPQQQNAFEFVTRPAGSDTSSHDSFTVSNGQNNKIRIEGNTTSALLSGLHRYLSDVAHVDIWWNVGSQLDKAPRRLPRLSSPLNGSSTVPYRYHFNTVTTSYTTPWWSWEDWELQLDWMALRGVNLALSWIGVEEVLIEVFRDIGLTDSEIQDFISGPAYLAWNHFGNMQGSWGGSAPLSWFKDQSALQLKILARMKELGITPILPAFPGFVPRNISRVYPDISVSHTSWLMPDPYNGVTYIDPFDPHFAALQNAVIGKQKQLYGSDVTRFWTLDQYNEMSPPSGDLAYLSNTSHNTWASLKSADPNAVWVMQGWMFHADGGFWTQERTKAFFDGVPVNEDMLILDLFAESQPVWQGLDSFSGKPWIWCQLHDYGGNTAMYGQIQDVTTGAAAALQSSASLVGYGLTMESQAGNEVMYDLLLDQAWSRTPIDTVAYFRKWVAARYNGQQEARLYSSWEAVRSTVYNNTRLWLTNQVSRGVPEQYPILTAGTPVTYDYKVLTSAWRDLYGAGLSSPRLFSSAAYQYDLVDWARQVLANAFQDMYKATVTAYQASASPEELTARGKNMTSLLQSLDAVLSTNAAFRLEDWIDAARASAGSDAAVQDFFEYEARTQLTFWGPDGQLDDYCTREWGGLVRTYYQPRWQLWIDYITKTPAASYNQGQFDPSVYPFEYTWGRQNSTTGNAWRQRPGDLATVMRNVTKQWPDIFNA